MSCKDDLNKNQKKKLLYMHSHTHLHVAHGLLQLLQAMGRAQSLQANICQFALLLPQLRPQLCYHLVVCHLSPL